MKDIAQAVDKQKVETASREDRIREVACREFLARGDGAGDPATDWFDAESEVDANDSQR